MQDNPSILAEALIPEAVQELFRQEHLLGGMRAFLPEELIAYLLKEKDQIRNVVDFQSRIILPILKLIEQASITKLTSSGLDHLDKNEKYLFISNHRDIVLDSAYLNTVLFGAGFTTSQIAIGDNLIKHRISELIFRINKSFVVKRTGTAMELYHYSVKLSEYIRDTVTSKTDSVWIAQREGRAKDGNDRTQVGLLKMLSLSNSGDLKSFFQDLKIVPVAISYEFDPCDVLKAREYLRKKTDPDYKKEFSEDVEHMLLGIKGKKGQVHFHFGKPLVAELEAFSEAPNAKKQLEMLAGLIDRDIHQHYALHPVNYVACDLLQQSSEMSAHYSPEDKANFTEFFERRSDMIGTDLDGDGREYLLRIYANPALNRIAGEAPETQPN